MVASTGNHRNTYASMLADATLAQKLDIITKGLSGELAVSFDDFGKMFDKSIKLIDMKSLFHLLKMALSQLHLIFMEKTQKH